MTPAKVDTSAFNAMCKTGARLSAVPYDVFVRSEVGKVMEAAVKFTPAIQVQKARMQHESAQFSSQPASMYSPKSKGPRNIKTNKKGGGYIVYYLGNRYPNQLWGAMSGRRRAKLARILGARGLAKKSWLRIAEELGIAIKAPGFVRKAIATTQKQYPDISTRVQKSQSQIRIDITNAQPTVNIPRVGGAKALRLAISGRVKFYEQNVMRLVFNDVAKIAKAYPGIKAHLVTT